MTRPCYALSLLLAVLAGTVLAVGSVNCQADDASGDAATIHREVCPLAEDCSDDLNNNPEDINEQFYDEIGNEPADIDETTASDDSSADNAEDFDSVASSPDDSYDYDASEYEYYDYGAFEDGDYDYSDYEDGQLSESDADTQPEIQDDQPATDDDETAIEDEAPAIEGNQPAIEDNQPAIEDESPVIETPPTAATSDAADAEQPGICDPYAYEPYDYYDDYYQGYGYEYSSEEPAADISSQTCDDPDYEDYWGGELTADQSGETTTIADDEIAAEVKVDVEGVISRLRQVELSMFFPLASQVIEHVERWDVVNSSRKWASAAAQKVEGAVAEVQVAERTDAQPTPAAITENADADGCDWDDWQCWRDQPISGTEEVETDTADVTVDEVPAPEVVTDEELATEVVADEVPAPEIAVDEVPAPEVAVDKVPAPEVAVVEVPATEVTADEVPAPEVTLDEVPAPVEAEKHAIRLGYIAKKHAILLMAGVLDRAGETLQSASRRLSEIAGQDVAKIPGGNATR